MSWRIIKALITTDYRNYFRDKFFGIMTVFAIVVFVIFYFIMPNTVDETIEIGVYAPDALNVMKNLPEEDAVSFHHVETEDELKQAIIDKKFYAGISIPEDSFESYLSGERPRIFVYYSSDISDEIKEMNTVLIGEMINELSGYTLDIEDVEIVLGPDMGGRQIPYRKRIMPFLLFMLLTSEIIGLSNLITSEIKTGTIQALLGTPMKVIDFFAGKGITGMTMAFFQIVILMVVTNSLSRHISLVVVTLILGAMMVTGLAFIVASVSKDMMSVIAWGTLVWIIMVIPAVAVIFPGPVSVWIKVIPSYYIVDTLHRAVNFDVGWSGNVRNVLLLSGCNGAFVFFGIFALNRKLR